ncbi:MAG: glycerol acyltransferase [Deltaproteobacteria bacterium HGW-Deltaproteobacteria-4]|nr:MAG: glycerol acyltransferase [Deltaproteobacteria bacterium HGW-Deltaproteobacteria-4]
MNRRAYLTSGRAIALLENLSRVRINMHGRENLSAAPTIFVINHFTRIETLLLPFHIYSLTQRPVWSLADAAMFRGTFGNLLDALGAVSTKAPDRDRLMVKSLLTGEANWIIFPEGCMVKDKLILEQARYAISCAGGRKPPHTGAATLALRTEFYRKRLLTLANDFPAEAARLRALFGIVSSTEVLTTPTQIIPVNITYYPLRAKENALSRLAERYLGDLPERFHEELLIEGAMLLEGVDIDIRFGAPLAVGDCLDCTEIMNDINSVQRIDFEDRLPSLHAMRKEALRVMQSYMDAIYMMTTVNHDHLFASLLRTFPFNKMTPVDFRRRIFLLSNDLTALGLHQHHSLEEGQLALLTDDRFNKYHEFLALALETGVLRQEGVYLVKDPTKFSSPLALNRARIDNPIGVLANEVLPLSKLQKRIRFYAYLPPLAVRYLVAKEIIKGAEQEFEVDYQSFFQRGESRKEEVGRPVLLRGSSRKLGIVLVHGFLAAPREMIELASYLQQRGWWVYVLRVKGHGTSPADLARRKGSDWQNSVDVGYAALSTLCDKVIVGGFSFGGGLALDCAARIPQVIGVFAVSPPMQLQDLSSRFAPTIAAWNRLMDVLKRERGKKEYAEIFPEHPEINYHRLPIVSLIAMENVMKALAAKLPMITVPTLIVQAKGDPVVTPDGSKRLFEKLGAKEKEYLLVDLNRHGILSGPGAEQVHSAIAAFIERVLKSNETKN